MSYNKLIKGRNNIGIYQDTYLKNHCSIGIPLILAVPPEANPQRLQHASRPWIAKIPSQIEVPHIRLDY